LLKLGIRVCKRTIQKYMRHVRTPRSRGQNWRTFLNNHAGEIWARDFLQVTDLFFRSLFAFFNTLLRSRKVIHVGVTRAPTDAWTAQQLREATAYGHTPKYLIRDHDSKFGPGFARVASRERHQGTQNALSHATCSVFHHHHPGFLHFVTKQPTYIPEHGLSAKNQIVEAQQEADERLRRRYQQAPPPRAARFLLEGSKRRPRHERFVA
jgi:hypothetical protein